MKKYLLGLFAIVLAVGFSAFTKPAKVSTSKKSTIYWYQVTYPGGVKTIASGQSAIERQSDEDNSDLDCLGTFRDCEIAYSTPQSLPLTGASNVDNQFKVEQFKEDLP